MSTLHLYELTGQLRALQQLQEAEELPDEVIRDTLEGVEGDFQDKAVAVAHVIRNLETAGEAIAKQAARQKKRAEILTKRSEQLKAYLTLNMQATGIRKIHHTDFDLRVQNSPPSAVIDDEKLVPVEYMRMCVIERMARDKGSIRELLSNMFEALDVDVAEPTEFEIEAAQSVLMLWAAPAFTPHEPDKTVITAAHKQGVEVPGTHPHQGEHLRIVE